MSRKAPASMQGGEPVAQAPPVTEPDRGDLRPHVFPLLVGVFDAHINHVDYFDTVGGEELRRLYRRRQARHHRAAARPSSPSTRSQHL